MSEQIYSDPEIAFNEVRSAERIVEMLRGEGAAVTAPAWGLPTAFVADTGSARPCLALFSEYDALPLVGHACGHNLIAAWSVVSFLALQDVSDILGIRVRLIGSPAEESGAGKQLIMDQGGLNDVDWAAMVHPAPQDVLLPNVLAMSRFYARYLGVEAHAAAFPWRGRNAADAATVAETAIGLLRQQMHPSDRVHTARRTSESAVNVIPDRAAIECMVRSTDDGALESLKTRVLDCFQAGATATGTELHAEPAAPDYAAMQHDLSLAALFRHAGREAEIDFLESEPLEAAGSGLVTISTDMGNISRRVPSIHPMIGIPTNSVNHQAAFADACAGPEARAWIRRTAIATVLFAGRLTPREQT
ncbi:amidohydrolase [Arthrobacter sp. CAU 1506]|uniref:amidohydrolase n=1 Tax=Arthrobacter sp. CAU 1506 TaxID=2560052 RepID=UPI00145C84C0|nr:amidohydrolase [Arthrobacter sp. CAU 1506]